MKSGRTVVLGWWAVAIGVALSACSPRAVLRNPFPDLPSERRAAPLAPEHARADLDELRALIERTTPNTYACRSREETASALEALKGSIVAPVGRREFSLVVSKACATFGIGHVYAIFPHEDWNDWVDAGGRSPSMSMDGRDGRLVTVGPGRAGGVPAGAVVRSINGVQGEELLAEVRASISAETDEYRDEQVAAAIPRVLWQRGVEAPFTVEVEPPGGPSRTIHDDGLIGSRKDSFFSPTSFGAPASTSSGGDGGPFSLSWPRNDVALIEWSVMDPRTEREWSEFLSRSFEEIRGRSARGVIIDVRKNRGGSGGLSDVLLGHLTERPYRQSGGKLWRKSAEYDGFLRSCLVWWARPLPWRSMLSAEYAGMSIDEERLFEGGPTPAPRREPRFDGPVCLLIGRATFSSAAQLADAAQTYGIATLVGAPTGGVPGSHGEIGFSRLKESGLVVAFCSAQFIRASGDEKDVSTVRPDVPVPEAEAVGAAISTIDRQASERRSPGES